jgi:hypothetical protein
MYLKSVSLAQIKLLFGMAPSVPNVLIKPQFGMENIVTTVQGDLIGILLHLNALPVQQVSITVKQKKFVSALLKTLLCYSMAHAYLVIDPSIGMKEIKNAKPAIKA